MLEREGETGEVPRAGQEAGKENLSNKRQRFIQEQHLSFIPCS